MKGIHAHTAALLLAVGLALQAPAAAADEGAYFVHTEVDGPGRIDGPSDGWQAAGSTIDVRAVPGLHARFVKWTGDVPDAWSGVNPLTLTLDHSRALVAHFVLDVSTHYVSPAGGNQAPYDSWQTAATNIQAAVDVAGPGAVVVVGDGVYDSGAVDTVCGRARVAVTGAVTVTSLNGPATTWIVGQGPIGDAAVRGVYLSSNAVFSGFTVTNGHTRDEATFRGATRGGGIYCEPGAVVSNCWIVGNAARRSGGGVHQGLVIDSVISGNGAEEGGGASRATLDGCAVAVNWATVRAGGASACSVSRSLVRGNVAIDEGGIGGGQVFDSLISWNHALVDGGGVGDADVFESVIVSNTAGARGGGVGLWSGNEARNCLVLGNEAQAGGGIYLDKVSVVANCTVVGNRAVIGGGILDTRGGALVENAIVSDNDAVEGANWHMPNGPGNWYFTCTDPTPKGWGNFNKPPRFTNPAALNFQLDPTSPCLNAGTNRAWMTDAADLAGQARIFGGIGDLGAYELAAYPLDIVAGYGGQVDPGSGYQAAGATVLVTASAADGNQFVCWSGDVPAEHAADNPLGVVMDRPRRIAASFCALPPPQESETAASTEIVAAIAVEPGASSVAEATEDTATPATEETAQAEPEATEPEAPAEQTPAVDVVVPVVVAEAIPPPTTDMDTDGDGMTDADEVRAGTNPLDANDVLGITSIESMSKYQTADAASSKKGFVIVWGSKNGARYSVEYSTNLAEGFEVLESNIVGVTPMQTFVDPEGSDERRYYRIRLE